MGRRRRPTAARRRGGRVGRGAAAAARATAAGRTATATVAAVVARLCWPRVGHPAASTARFAQPARDPTRHHRVSLGCLGARLARCLGLVRRAPLCSDSTIRLPTCFRLYPPPHPPRRPAATAARNAATRNAATHTAAACCAEVTTDRTDHSSELSADTAAAAVHSAPLPTDSSIALVPSTMTIHDRRARRAPRAAVAPDAASSRRVGGSRRPTENMAVDKVGSGRCAAEHDHTDRRTHVPKTNQKRARSGRQRTTHTLVDHGPMLRRSYKAVQEKKKNQTREPHTKRTPLPICRNASGATPRPTHAGRIPTRTPPHTLRAHRMHQGRVRRAPAARAHGSAPACWTCRSPQRARR